MKFTYKHRVSKLKYSLFGRICDKSSIQTNPLNIIYRQSVIIVSCSSLPLIQLEVFSIILK